MRKLLLFLLLISFPFLSFADSETTIGGKTAQSHIIQNNGMSLRPRPYLNFTTGLTCSDVNGKTECAGLPGYNDADSQNATGWVKNGSNVYLHTSSDNVGIGTSVPNQKLDVRGNVLINNNSLANLTIKSIPEEVFGVGGDSVYNITVGADIYRVHVFSSVGNHTFVVPYPRKNLEVLVVAGGGGAGTNNGGGGGAGGLIYTNIELTELSAINVVVGDGGIGTNNRSSNASPGGNSSFGDLVAIGGGRGASGLTSSSSGGSGGGGSPSGTRPGSSGTPGQGYAGGTAIYSGTYPGGGGGGATGNGGAPTAGPGISINITGSSTTYSLGGRAGYDGSSTPTNEAANTGNGGDGGGNNGAKGGNGGSGIVVVRYIITSTSQTESPYILFDGAISQLWKIQNDGDDFNKLKILDSTTAQLTIMPTSGNIGIGTVNPSEKLEVNGTGKFITAINTPKISNLTTNGFVKTSGSNGTLGIDTNTYLTSEADTLATVTARGATTFENIGIGTSSPNSQLEIGGSFASKTTIVSGNTTLDATHHRIIVTNTATITLPTAVGIAGREYNIINGLVGIGTVTIATTSGQTIRGDASLEMYDRGSVVVISDGANWERGN